MGIYRNLLAKSIIWVCEKGLVGEHCGIKLADLNWNEADDSAFVEKTKQALDLIRDLDPRRFARVQRHIDYICNKELECGGKYYPCNVCLVDFGRFDFARNPDWSLYMYSSLFVHEATHGLLHARGFRRTKRNWKQIERICQSEENRFLSRIDSPWGDQLCRPFDPAEWDLGSWLTRAMTRSRRIGEERKKAQQSLEGDVLKGAPGARAR
jgi:hypothetical protein